ncbi:MAG: type II secretion system F family protein [Erysipelotrichia bacterium]|jgi:type IV pilus assembly protein PilC|nr:type II secretion system F family protein [Erysipelotrichia bacterium]
MKSFQVKAIDARGKNVNEVIFAESVDEMLQTIKSKSLFLVDYYETKSATKSISKLPVKSLVIFCRQLGTMIGAGIPIMQSLSMLLEKADSPKSKRIYRNVFEEVQKGNSLSAAMQIQEGVFPELLNNMIMAGELSGTLDLSLNRMAAHFEKEAKLRNKIRSASIYPSVLGVFSVAVVLALVTFVLPSITSMFPAERMPWTTTIILGFSDFLLSNWIVLVIGFVFLIITINLLLKIRDIRVQWDKFKLFMPIIGKLNQTIYSARAARSLSSLYSSGVQVLDMLETTGRVLGNVYLEDMFMEIIDKVSRGELISKSIAETGSFDPMLSSMIYVGEETGAIGDILDSTADYFDNEADSALQRMISLIEPMMIIVLGFVVGFIVLSIIQPIFQMYEIYQ